jgi:hypothetical protein
MPVDYKRYPKDWKEISKRIRFERAGNKCEWCGVGNGNWVLRDGEKVREWNDGVLIDGHIYVANVDEDGHDISETECFRANDAHPTRIILTVAHLGTAHADGTPGDKHDKMDVRDENLAALCQKCHLNYDRDEHMVNAAKTRARKRQAAIVASGQLGLLEVA